MFSRISFSVGNFQGLSSHLWTVHSLNFSIRLFRNSMSVRIFVAVRRVVNYGSLVSSLFSGSFTELNFVWVIHWAIFFPNFVASDIVCLLTGVRFMN